MKGPLNPHPWPILTSREEFRFLADLVFRHASADHAWVTVHDTFGGTTRFANNQVIQNGMARRVSMAVHVAFGRRHGTASTTDLSAGSVQETLRQAERLARTSVDDPEYLSPPASQAYAAMTTSWPDTAAAGPTGRLARAATVVTLCQAAGLTAAGIVASSQVAAGVAARTGLFAHEVRTEARFSLTAQGGDSTGSAAAVHRSIDRLDIENRTRAAIDTARRSAAPKAMPAGRYAVILASPAVAGLLGGIMGVLGAKSYFKNTNPLRGKLGQRILDERLTFRNVPDHPDLLGTGFTGEGLPSMPSVWIERGVLKQLSYDRFTAREHHVDPIPTLEAPQLGGEEPGDTLEALIAGTERGILVSNVWYVRSVNPADLMLTGVTRDGTFLIENGRIATGLRNFRWHESPLGVFNRIDAYTASEETVSPEGGKLLVPAMRIREFHFTSTTVF